MPTFLDHLPDGVSYPHTDPYIQELNRRMPGTEFDRYLPSETVRRDIEKMRDRIAVECQRPLKAAQKWPSKNAHLAEVTSL